MTRDDYVYPLLMVAGASYDDIPETHRIFPAKEVLLERARQGLVRSERDEALDVFAEMQREVVQQFLLRKDLVDFHYLATCSNGWTRALKYHLNTAGPCQCSLCKLTGPSPLGSHYLDHKSEKPRRNKAEKYGGRSPSNCSEEDHAKQWKDDDLPVLCHVEHALKDLSRRVKIVNGKIENRLRTNKQKISLRRLVQHKYLNTIVAEVLSPTCHNSSSEIWDHMNSSL